MSAGRHPRQHLAALALGELDGPEARSVKDHVLSCPECAQEVARLKDIVEDLKTMPQMPLPTGFHERILKATEGLGPFAQMGAAEPEAKSGQGEPDSESLSTPHRKAGEEDGASGD